MCDAFWGDALCKRRSKTGRIVNWALVETSLKVGVAVSELNESNAAHWTLNTVKQPSGQKGVADGSDYERLGMRKIASAPDQVTTAHLRKGETLQANV